MKKDGQKPLVDKNKSQMVQVKKVTIISTGGTIDKVYDEENGVMKNNGPLIVKNVQSFLRLPYCELNFIDLMSKDSLHMDEHDRQAIADCIRKHAAQTQAIVVLHGTDTMDKTAKFCSKLLDKLTIPIIFTGAMKPYGIDKSDAVQNLTESLLAAKILPKGVYIVLHNQVFHADFANKNYSKLTFEHKESDLS